MGSLTADFGRFHTGYTPKPATAPLRVWGKNRGDAAPALFEVGNASRDEAIRAVRRAGFARAMVEVK